MGYESAERHYRRERAAEVAGARLMLRAGKKLVVAFLVLWAAVGALGLVVGHQEPAGRHGAPAQHHRGHR